MGGDTAKPGGSLCANRYAALESACQWRMICEREAMMGKETRLFKSEERKSRSDVSAFLHQLADKVSEGQVVLRQGQEEITLQLPRSLILEVQVEDEDKKS
jgi:amphi-Trp domain-containing protein